MRGTAIARDVPCAAQHVIELGLLADAQSMESAGGEPADWMLLIAAQHPA
jgi:hypothetical protein